MPEMLPWSINLRAATVPKIDAAGESRPWDCCSKPLTASRAVRVKQQQEKGENIREKLEEAKEKNQEKEVEKLKKEFSDLKDQLAAYHRNLQEQIEEKKE